MSAARAHRHPRPAAALVLCAFALAIALSPAPALASPALSWSSPAPFDSGRSPSAISCGSESLCVTVDREGYALSTGDPTALAPSWTATPIDTGAAAGESLSAVSCSPAGPCVAVDGRGDAFSSVDPPAVGWTSVPIDAGTALTAVSCPATLCVAVDAAGRALTTTRPASTDWQSATIDAGHRLTGVSCASPTLCVAVDDVGDVLASTDPAGGSAAWTSLRIDAEELLAVSCWSAGACVALDAAGDALASIDPGATTPTWSRTPVDSPGLSAVSCASSGLCVTVDARGEALASDDPTGAAPAWVASGADSGPPTQSLTGISCQAGGLCVAVDAAGRALQARVPAPSATTLAASEVTSTSATLAGAVNPNDAVLGACSFEYGTAVVGGLYDESIPCSTLPVAVGGVQDVAAQLPELSPNTTYHYRVLASSPIGTSAGADASFTTATSTSVALVHPNPSITGTPANGQRLTCHPNVPEGAAAQLSYAWLRDQIPILGATGSTYTVKGQDTGHHLQCQVTATDGGGSASAKSAFVTIPAGGVPASAGETRVGRVTFRGGRVSVAVACSALAAGGCQVSLRVSAASARHRTITLASARAHLARGAHATIVATLGTVARRLLARRRRLGALAVVRGTVIGSIQAQLAHQSLTLGASAHGAGSHGANRR